jgi:uncharacterized protein
MDIGKRFRMSFLAMIPLTGLICILALAASAEEVGPSMPTTGESTAVIPITVGQKTIQAHVADSEPTRRQGLLGWSTITDETGMLLDFVVEGTYAIHMQGMKFPIDAIWVDSKGMIKFIFEDIPPNSGRIYPSMFPCRYCLEVKAGFCHRYGIRMGDHTRFGATDR